MSERVVSCSFLQNNISTLLKYDTWYLKKKLWQIGIFSITLKPLQNKWDGMFAYMYLGKLRKSLNKEILSLITQKESCPWKLEGYFYYLIWKTFFNLKKNQFPLKKKHGGIPCFQYGVGSDYFQNNFGDDLAYQNQTSNVHLNFK